MENQNRDAAHRPPELSAPVLPETAAFSASKVERICALLMYLLAFCYVQALFTLSVVGSGLAVCVYSRLCRHDRGVLPRAQARLGELGVAWLRADGARVLCPLDH